MWFCALLAGFFPSFSQRTYKPASVLASGNWYKIAVAGEGVYKIDIPFLNALGITGSISSSQIRLFGNDGGMLSESNSATRPDDLEENAIWVEDGGDGILNGSDYILFFSNGPDQWIKDSTNKRFSHKKNLYSDKAYYFLSIGGTGKRIPVQSTSFTPVATVTSFDERFFHEQDTVNFLNSGKEWFGEEFSALPGRSLSQSFTLPITDVVTSQTGTLISNMAARSINTPARFTVAINTQQVQQIDIPLTTTNQYDLFAKQTQKIANLMPPNNPVVTFSYSQGAFNSQGWLNWFEFFCRRTLNLPANKQLLFRDWSTVGNSAVQFQISNADAATQVWDVTDPLNPVKMNATLSSNQLRFSNDAQRLREYACFSGSFLTPVSVGRIANQNLHTTANADFLIVSEPAFISQAQRLAQFHQQRSGLRTVVVTTEQVYNEFSSGIPDPTAIRDFTKMYYDKYRSTWSQSGKYLLLFGKGSFDYKNRIANNTNFVPVYETPNSLDPLASYTSDDFFGFLDDNEDINSVVVINQLDIGIGRIPAKNADDAKNFVDKLLDYHSPSAFGPWRNNFNFIADDEDNNLHLQDAEAITATVSGSAPVFNNDKIYLDAFQQESGSAGGRYPQVNAAINNNIYNGTLIWNYNGHGGPDRLAEEDILDQTNVNTWSNQYRLPLFITATCDFAAYDNPSQFSLGENLIIRPKSGAIALMTTTRVVFANSNLVMNNNYMRIALQPDASGRYKTLGEAVQAAKNYTYQTSSDVTNNRKFSLLGDPAMTVAFPTLKVQVNAVNGNSISNAADTLSATESVTIEGQVNDNTNNLLSNFNGTVYLTLFDKPTNIKTLANDPTSIPVTFTDQNSSLFKGKASAQNGKFSLKFKMPKDINYQYGNGKISLYAQDGIRDGNGFNTNVLIGGISNNPGTDNAGPVIKAYLNDDKFVNGSITNSAPVLIVHLSDSSGINTGSSGIDHDIVATLNNDAKNYYVLNTFYEADLNSFQQGSINFQLPQLNPGTHSLKIKAWDVLDNSSEYVLDFIVVNNDELRIDHVLNYPNPFTTNTHFWFEHNYPGVDLYTKVEIFTVSGKLIKTLTRTINTAGNRSSEVEWDGKDEYGNKIGRGVYIYRLKVRSATGKTAEKWEKLVILN